MEKLKKLNGGDQNRKVEKEKDNFAKINRLVPQVQHFD